MYLTSFIHRRNLLDIAERWFCGRPEKTDGLALTEILICDGYVAGVTLEELARRLIGKIYPEPFEARRIHLKGELRDAILRCPREMGPRVQELCREYRNNPDFYYTDAPINGVMCLDGSGQLVGLYRLKRPKRIAEKANRRLANWIFESVQTRARRMAEERAGEYGIPLDRLLTPEREMVQEFVQAERGIARSFQAGEIKFDMDALTINDVAGMKIICDEERLSRLQTAIAVEKDIEVVEREHFRGNYRADSLILRVGWDREQVERRYRDSRAWEKYLNRGVPEERLRAGIEPLFEGGDPRINVELILTTFPEMVESELGRSIHEERIIAQRDNKVYKGYIPLNVEFLLEYLFSVGFSPEVNIDPPPIKMWGRYLPDTLTSYIRRLYRLPEYDFFF